MGLLTSLLTLPFSGPPRTALWAIEQVASAAEAELYDEGRIVAELRGLNAALDDGQITERQYEHAEAQLLERLAAARAR